MEGFLEHASSEIFTGCNSIMEHSHQSVLTGFFNGGGGGGGGGGGILVLPEIIF